MARTSQRLSGNATKHKRILSNSSIGNEKRAKVEHDYQANSEDTSGSDDEGDESDFAGEESSEAEEQSEEEDDYDSEDDRPKSRKKVTPRKNASARSSVTTAQTDVWREGVSAGQGPGKQVIIKKPKPRPAGKIPYDDETLHPNTFLFLADLKQNNNRPWLKMHDPDFRQSEKDWFSFVEKLQERLVEIDETVPELPIKDVIFRIYRDVRFSPDPTPYKAFFSVAFSRTGRKGPFAHYYVQIGPEESFVGGGLWHPDAAPTAAMRNAIDRRSRRLKDILLRDDIRKEFLKGAPKNDAKVVKAFAASNAENALKTKPKGFDSDHADIDLLRLRNYTIGRKLSQAELVGDGGLDRVASLFACMEPFITYLNSVVMPDPDQDDADQEDDPIGGDSGDE